ncbi:glycosyltransferase family A protein [Agrobacterium rosae]|uniref:Glycosyltransferase family A protein n=1 Tax=Agrobacterium rosae TaxID=1972867 RepID=A0ABU4W4T7_9HYPH|nr:glycosyltransferase family A protein [Agrobacterium rosae]MDX8332795.1 glycosyltransferase family A protein [Agrobacterium rosae]
MAFQKLDVHGLLSDLIGDPGTTLFRPVFHLAPNFPGLKKSGPLVSVIVATRNDVATIERSIMSLINQTYHSLEIIVVDDASDDGASAIISSLANRDSRVVHLLNDSQRGTGASRNVGLRAASGMFATFHDGDDVSEPKRLELQMRALGNDRTKELCLCSYVRTNNRGRGIEINDQRMMKCIISMMFRRELVLNRVGFFLNESVGEDSDFYERIKIVFGANSEVVLPKILYRALYRRGSSFFSSVEVLTEDEQGLRYKVLEESARRNELMKKRHAAMRASRAALRVE